MLLWSLDVKHATNMSRNERNVSFVVVIVYHFNPCGDSPALHHASYRVTVKHSGQTDRLHVQNQCR